MLRGGFRQTVLLALFLAWVVGVSAACGAEIGLTVDWGGVTMPGDFPVTGGIPFPRGVLAGPEGVCLLAGGRQLPLQTEALARWPDGSVKWLLLDFQAVPGRKDLLLQYGPGVRARNVERGIVAGQQSGTVTLDTGRVALSVRSDGTGFLDALSFDGKPIFTSTEKRLNFLDFIHTESPADYHPMNRYLREGEPDPSGVVVDEVALEKAGPLHAVVRIDGRYTYRRVGSTIRGTDVKGDCPFRIRIHAYAGQSFLRVEHFFYYEGDGDHDFARSLGLKIPLPPGASGVRFVGNETIAPTAPISGLYQQNADSFVVWQSAGRSASGLATGSRFEGMLDVTAGPIGVAVGVKDFWQTAAKGLRADLAAGELGIYLWPPEAPPLDFRRHAREWSVGETGTPDDPQGSKPTALQRPAYRLASKGVGKTHYALIYCHPAGTKEEDLLKVYRLFNHRPLLWASPRHYAESLALGRYRECVPGEHDRIEAVLASGLEVWKASRERFRWYGFWLFGNVCQDYNGFIPNGRWCREFGRWGWAGGDSVGRLAYALMLQTVRKCTRDDFELGESYLFNVHDVWSTHTPAYPQHYGGFQYVKGAAHRHGAWPWACLYVGARGAHPVGAKIYYYLTGEGHARDILEEITQLALRNPNGGEGDGPLGPNAQIFLYQWEATGDDQWRGRLRAELENSELLRSADSGWLCMMSAAFGIQNALEEYIDLSGDDSMKGLAADFADRSMPQKMKRHWTWGGYFRVYASAYNVTRDPKYAGAIEEMFEVLSGKAGESLALKVPPDEWPGPAGGPKPFIDANIIRDVPFALYSLHLADKEGK